MSDDDKNKPNGDGPDDGNDEQMYGDEQNSGVFKSARIRLGNFEGEDRTELKALIDERFKAKFEENIAWQNICGIRKEMRDSFRGIFERTEWLADLFGVKYIPPVTAQKIADEEEERKQRRARKLLKRAGDSHPTASHAENAKNDLDKESKIMNAEEYAKYIAGKNTHLLEKGEYKKWRDTMLDLRLRFTSDPVRKVFYNVIKTEAEKAFTEALKRRDAQRITDGLMYLGGIELFDPEDLIEVPEEIFTSPEIKKYFIDLLAEIFPNGYFGVRTHLVRLGFFKDQKEIDAEPVILAKAKNALWDALFDDQEVFAALRDTFIAGGLKLEFTEKEEEPFRKKILKKLGEAAMESPGKYLALRNQLQTLKIMDAEDADGDDAVRWNLLGHKLAWKANDRDVLLKLEYYWRSNGLKVMDELSWDEFDEHPDKAYRKNPAEFVHIDYKPAPWELELGNRSERALYYFEREKRKYERFPGEMAKFSEDRASISTTKMVEFNAKFPQYNPQNGGRGYEAEFVE